MDQFKNDFNFKFRLKFFVDISVLIIMITLLLLLGEEYFSTVSKLINFLVLFFVIFILQYLIFQYTIQKEMHDFVGNDVYKKIKQSNTYNCNTFKLLQKNLVSFKSLQKYINELKQGSLEIQCCLEDMERKAHQSMNSSEKELQTVLKHIEKVNNLKQKIKVVAELIVELSDYIRQIETTIRIIEDISEQTNMLALNAAVEAARAGEHGKGFSIVATEIRKLADESKQATSKVSSLLSEIQYLTNSTVVATEEGSQDVEITLNVANALNENLKTVLDTMSEISKQTLQSANCFEKSKLKIEDIDIVSKQFNENMEIIYSNIEKNVNVLSSNSTSQAD